MKKLILAVFLILIGAGQLLAQQRIGFAEPQLILDSIPERDRIERELERFFNEWENDYENLYERYSEELFLYQDSRAQLSESQIRQEEMRLREMAEELEFMQQEFGMVFEQKRAELLGPVVERINEAIATIARQKNLDYVFQSETSNAEPMFFIIKTNPNAINITDDVIARMNP
ncbi:MAG: OmpH family outer membrane protein [Balneolales bacterium]|nr:OmpH family outer membrane protein [Balneolales bacterium]